MAQRSDHEKWVALCKAIEEELKTAKLISASPTRAGHYVQVRIRMGKRTGRHSFYQPIPIKIDDTVNRGVLENFLRDICNVYVSTHYSIIHSPEFQNLLDSDKLLELYTQSHAAACKQVRNCGQQHDLSQRIKAKKALKSWILLAYDHGMKDAQLVELFNECRAEHVLRS